MKLFYVLRYWGEDRDLALGLYDSNHKEYVKELCRTLNQKFNKDNSRQGVYYEELELNKGTKELDFQLSFLKEEKEG